MQYSYWALHRGTSPIDWCEGNYLISPFIAEFVNTFSNILFFVFPPLLTGLFREYAECVNRGIYLIWGLLLTVGFASAYFHATLSLVGQLLDELAILWLVNAAFALWLPRRYISYAFKEKKNFQISIFIISCAVSCLACIHPALNAFVLMGFVVPVAVILLSEIRRCKSQRVVRLGYRCAWVWLVAVICWLNDRLFCEIWSKLHFPYLHGAWHILVAIGGCNIFALFAYFDALDTVPQQLPVMRFWPSNRLELGVPYISLTNARKVYKEI